MKGIFFLHIRRWQLPAYWQNLKITRRVLNPLRHVRIANAHIFYFFCFEIIIGANWQKAYVERFGRDDCKKTNSAMTKFIYEVRGKGGMIVYLYKSRQHEKGS